MWLARFLEQIDISELSHEVRENQVASCWGFFKFLIPEIPLILQFVFFSRHEVTDKENQPSVQVQVRNLKLGIVTFWNLDKFEYKLAAMKDLYEVTDKLNA